MYRCNDAIPQFNPVLARRQRRQLDAPGNFLTATGGDGQIAEQFSVELERDRAGGEARATLLEPLSGEMQQRASFVITDT